MKQNIYFGQLFFLLSICIFWQCNNKSNSNPTSADRPLIVSGGPDTTVKLNEEVYLAGSATEGGAPVVPAPPAPTFTYSWKQVTGPDTVQIFSPSTQTTTIQFRQTGTYQISLTVSDGSKTKSDTVVYTVLASIPLLNVSGGPDTTVRLNEEVYLAGSASEDGVSDTVFTYSWNQVSGPDTVLIFSPSTQITKIQFRQTGIYRFSLTVSDGVISKSDTLVYTVIDSIVFKVLKPASGDRVIIGDSMLVIWQIVTPLPQTMIDLSIDHGKTWDVLSFPSVLNDTQWVWHVDPSLLPNDSCLVKVRDYQNSSHFVISGYFSLVSQ